MTDVEVEPAEVTGAPPEPPEQLGLVASTEVEQRRWQLINGAVMPLWVAMIVAPRSRMTQWLMDRSGYWFAGYSTAYVVQLVRTASGGTPGFDLDSLRAGMSAPAGFLTGWTHFLAFDLFVGRWIWQRALAEGRSSRVALFFTLMAGPAGLGIFGVQRRSFSPEHRPA